MQVGGSHGSAGRPREFSLKKVRFRGDMRAVIKSELGAVSFGLLGPEGSPKGTRRVAAQKVREASFVVQTRVSHSGCKGRVGESYPQKGCQLPSSLGDKSQMGPALPKSMFEVGEGRGIPLTLHLWSMNKAMTVVGCSDEGKMV